MSSGTKGSGLYKVFAPTRTDARRTAITGAEQSAFAASVSDFYFKGNQSFYESTIGRKTWYFATGPNTSTDILAIVALIAAEYPLAATPQLQVRAETINMYNNMLKSDATVEEIPIYSAQDNTFTAATIGSAWVTDWTRTFSTIPTPGTYEYYQWPTTDTFENKAFWQNRGIRALKSRIIKVPGGTTRVSRYKGKWETYSFQNLTSLAAGNTMTAFKTKWYQVSVLGTTMNTCDVFDGPTTRALPDAGAVVINSRQIIKYEYRWVNENSPTIAGEIRPTTYLPDPAVTATQYGPARVLQGHLPWASTDVFPAVGGEDLLPGISINPIATCAGEPFIPVVT